MLTPKIWSHALDDATRCETGQIPQVLAVIDGISVNGTLICLDTENVTVLDDFKNYGNISVGGDGTQSFEFNISASCANNQELPFVIMTESIFDTYSVQRNFTFELVVGRKLTLGGSTLQTATEITVGYTYGYLPGLGDDRVAWLKINCTKDIYLFLNLVY